MQAAQGRLGRVFVLRLEDGDRLPACLETFAAEQGIRAAFCSLVGGIGGGSLVVGPKDGRAARIEPMLAQVTDAHEAVAVGAIFPDSRGRPTLHMHAALGREESTKTGCVRPGLDIWKVAEVVILELLDVHMARKIDPSLGLELLTRE